MDKGLCLFFLVLFFANCNSKQRESSSQNNNFASQLELMVRDVFIHAYKINLPQKGVFIEMPSVNSFEMFSDCDLKTGPVYEAIKTKTFTDIKSNYYLLDSMNVKYRVRVSHEYNNSFVLIESAENVSISPIADFQCKSSVLTHFELDDEGAFRMITMKPDLRDSLLINFERDRRLRNSEFNE